MLTFHDIEKLVEDFTYKPNVEVTVHKDLWDFEKNQSAAIGLIKLRVTMWTLDANKDYPRAKELAGRYSLSMDAGIGAEISTSSGHYSLHPTKACRTTFIPESVLDDEDVFWNWLDHTIAGLEDHERKEWFRIKGKCYRDPHPELKDKA